MPASTKKIAPVPPAAMAIMPPPLEKPSATCRMRESIRPMKKVKASSRTTPMPLFLVFSMPHMKPQATPRNSRKAIIGLPAKKENCIWMPSRAPSTVGTIDRASRA